MAGRLSAIRRMMKRRDGAVTLEFALLALPFLLIISGIIEIGMIALSSTTLKIGVREASRETRTGQNMCGSHADLVSDICTNASFLPNCSDNITVTQETFATGWANLAQQGGEQAFQDAAGGDVVVVIANYDWEMLSPLMTPLLGDENGVFRMQQSFAFQTEPFEAADCGAGS